MKNLPEIAAVESARGRDILYRDIVLEILLNEREGLFDIKIPQAVSLAQLGGGRGTQEPVDKQIEMTDQVKRRFVFVVDDVEKLFLHDFGDILMICPIDWVV